MTLETSHNPTDERAAIIADAAEKARARLKKILEKKLKLRDNLRADLQKHGDPEEWKRKGDLLLANISTARREGDKVLLIDHFDENAPEIAIDVPRRLSVGEAASEMFRRYARARNGRAVIDGRIRETEKELTEIEALMIRATRAEEESDLEFLESVAVAKRIAPTEVSKKKRRDPEIKGVRRYVSSDGFEVLVGRSAKDNDHLTFRIARSMETWLHAADYPGSHVVIRNPNRKEIPQRTVVEAAQLAAFFSDARGLDKAAVHFTLRKFVNKPRRGSPGAVSLASFKTVLVRPENSLRRVDL